MKALIQRVKKGEVTVDGITVGKIDRGILIFLGITHKDTNLSAEYLAQRCVNLRIFEDDNGKMNLSVKDVIGEALVVSQFTLYADTRKGNRPSFTDAALPVFADEMYKIFVKYMERELGHEKVQTGEFRAMMDVALVNDGPVTIMIESKE